MSKFPAEPMAPTMLGMSTEENTAWLNAHRWAYRNIVDGLQRLESTKEATLEYEDWFAKSWPWTDRAAWEKRRNLVIDRMTKMATRMSTISVVYEKCPAGGPCSADPVMGMKVPREAFTDVSSHKIGLCPWAFDNDHLRSWYWDSPEWARALILVHETYHAAVNTAGEDTKIADSYYVWFVCKQLSRFNPDLAASNAQNYAYFAMGIGWTLRNTAPAWQADYGIWNIQTPGAGWNGAADSPAAAGTTEALMVAYRESDAQGGRLWSRIMLLDGDRSSWRDAKAFDALGPTSAPQDCTSLAAPALANDGMVFYCAYVDKASKQLVALKTDLRGQNGVGIRTDFRWEDIGMIAEGASEPLTRSDSKIVPSPAFAVYRSGPGKISFGLYCVYINNKSELTCLARLDETLSRWQVVSFGSRSIVSSTPSLVVFNGQLKCAYVPITTSKFVLLNYHPATKAPHFHDAAVGTWQVDRHPTPDDWGGDSVVLGQLNAPDGPKLVAIGNALAARDQHLRYSVYSEATGWSKVERLKTLTSTNVPALAPHGSSLYLFYRDANGLIQSRSAN